MRTPSICCVLAAGCWLLAAAVWAQSAGAAQRLTQQALAATGERLAGVVRLTTIGGEPLDGPIANGAFTIRVGFQFDTPALPPGTRGIVVEGTADEPVATVAVSVQGGPTVSATVNAAAFRLEGVPLTEGRNALTVTATDLVGHAASVTLTVFLDTHPPARPTIAPTPAVVTAATHTLTGTKMPDTSLWVNGVEIVPRNPATTWTATVSLVEGDNEFVVVAKDAAGNQSAGATITVVLDNLPPVLAVTAPAKTNLNPVTITGTVDDSLTRVTANGIAANRSGRQFDVAVPLTVGPNRVAVTATSPNGHATTQVVSITRGTVPTLTSLSPADGATVYQNAATTLQARATDAENDPLEFQFLVNGQIVRAWGASATHVWTPTQVAVHMVEAQVRDAFGGQGVQQAEVLVLEQPLFPPVAPPAGGGGGAQPPPAGGGGGGEGRALGSRVPGGALSAPAPESRQPPLSRPAPAELVIPFTSPEPSPGGPAVTNAPTRQEPPPLQGHQGPPAQTSPARRAPPAAAPSPATAPPPIVPVPAAPTAPASAGPSPHAPGAAAALAPPTPRGRPSLEATAAAPAFANPAVLFTPAAAPDAPRPRLVARQRLFQMLLYRLIPLGDFSYPFPRLVEHLVQEVEIVRQAFQRLTVSGKVAHAKQEVPHD